jgi:hypothetical protein
MSDRTAAAMVIPILLVFFGAVTSDEITANVGGLCLTAVFLWRIMVFYTNNRFDIHYYSRRIAVFGGAIFLVGTILYWVDFKYVLALCGICAGVAIIFQLGTVIFASDARNSDHWMVGAILNYQAHRRAKMFTIIASIIVIILILK